MQLTEHYEAYEGPKSPKDPTRVEVRFSMTKFGFGVEKEMYNGYKTCKNQFCFYF